MGDRRGRGRCAAVHASRAAHGKRPLCSPRGTETSSRLSLGRSGAAQAELEAGGSGLLGGRLRRARGPGMTRGTRGTTRNRHASPRLPVTCRPSAARLPDHCLSAGVVCHSSAGHLPDVCRRAGGRRLHMAGGGAGHQTHARERSVTLPSASRLPFLCRSSAGLVAGVCRSSAGPGPPSATRLPAVGRSSATRPPAVCQTSAGPGVRLPLVCRSVRPSASRLPPGGWSSASPGPLWSC